MSSVKRLLEKLSQSSLEEGFALRSAESESIQCKPGHKVGARDGQQGE